MSSVWQWGAKVLLGEKRSKVHGPAETYAPRSFISNGRGKKMLYGFLYPRQGFNRDLTQGWVHMGPMEHRKAFWVLTKHVTQVLLLLSAHGRFQHRPCNVQAAQTLHRWTLVEMKGVW